MQLRCNYIALSHLRNIMSTITNKLVAEIATKLYARDVPPMKDGVPYRILVFKGHQPERWVLAMVPDHLPVEELFVIVNESYGLFLKGEHTPNGIYFLCADQPEELPDLASHWHNTATTSFMDN